MEKPYPAAKAGYGSVIYGTAEAVSFFRTGSHADSKVPRLKREGLWLMAKQSAGLLMYRSRDGQLEVFLVHPGGPFWAKKDLGAWSISKGEYAPGEPALEAAKREFQEETGFAAEGDFLSLGQVKQAGGKVVSAWAFEGDCDPSQLISNRCEIEWPPRSGRKMEIAEVDRGDWFSIAQAKERILKSQAPLLERLSQLLRQAD